MDRFAVANALREMGRLLEARGESAFRVRAYERGARAVEGVADLGRLVDEDRLREVSGIGPVLASAIAELHRTGKSERLERLRAQLPPGILELSLVPGMTRKRIGALHQALGVRGLDEEQLKSAQFNEPELKRLEALGVARAEGEAFARRGQLQPQKVDYLAPPAQ